MEGWLSVKKGRIREVINAKNIFWAFLACLSRGNHFILVRKNILFWKTYEWGLKKVLRN